MVTDNDGLKWQAENNDELNRARLASKDEGVQMFNRINPAISKALWDAGSWLGTKLRELGATDEEVESVQFAHGQRCFGGQPWAIAAQYINEFAETKTVGDKPGPELAEEITKEVFGD